MGEKSSQMRQLRVEKSVLTSPVNNRVLDPRRSAELVTLFLDLDSKLAGRRQDEDDRAVAGLQVRLQRDDETAGSEK